jgi:uncharacterized protein (TIGR02680 family)
MTVTELPHPPAAAEPDARTPRWVPARAGILNVWRYYDEVFTFHDGRLLLRGPNGSGKSKALELLLPFLLDASLRASRLSTFGTAERTMHWNLMGEGASGTTRVGYVWLEFCFPATDTGSGGAPGRWFGCGARLQASTHTTTVYADYFTTTARIGTSDGVALVNEAGQPLTRAALEVRLGDRGIVYGNAGDYRAAIRTALFPGLTEQRYDALITALLQLRTPKLSQRLDPALLSTLLSRALPPLGHQEISDLAEGFERLDRQRERLLHLDEEVAAAGTLAARQRAYAQRVLRAGAARLISATTELDNLTRAARQSAEQYELTSTAKTEKQLLNENVDRDAATIDARITGLIQSEGYQQGRELDGLRQQTAEARDRAAALRADADTRRTEADADASAVADSERAVQQRAEVAGALQAETRHAATRAGLASVHEEIAASLDTQSQPGQSQQDRSQQAQALLRAATTSRASQLAAVRGALDEHERAVDRRQQAEADLDVASTALSEAQAKQAAATQRHEAQLTSLGDKLTTWAATCRELAFPDPSALLDAIEPESALLALVDAAAAAVREEIVREETAAAAQRTASFAERADLARQVEQLAADQDLPPDAPPTRTADRTTMIGAPFWRLVDFSPHTTEAARGPIEAALQASGLLDAWVGPSGTVTGHDTFADPAALAPAPGRSLADVLVAEHHPAVPDTAIQRLLAAIAFGDRLPDSHPAAIGADGSWRLGNLHGSWRLEHPAHVGTAARQRARERRIRVLRGQIVALDDAIAALDTRLGALADRRITVANERALRPDHRELTEAAEAVVGTLADVAAADRVVRQRVDTVADREKQVSTALLALTRLAAENGLPADRTALNTLAEAIDRFREQAGGWLDAHGQLVMARHTLDTLARQAVRTEELARQREQEASDAEARHRELAATLQAVEDTIGVDYREILTELAGLRAQLRELRQQLRAGQQEVMELTDRLGELRARRSADVEARDAATAVRDAAVQRFRHLAGGVFAADSGLVDLPAFHTTLSGSDGVRATLEAARQVAAAWPTLPYALSNLGDALHRLSESVHACRDTLSARADLDLETDEDVQVFSAVVNGVRAGAAELLHVLREEAERSRQEITDAERELFDQTLTGDTRRHLADRIRQANDLVDRMNARLERVRTASKVAVRLTWQVAPDLPPGTKAARDLLLKDPVRLTDEDRESLHRFFRERIEQAKADDTAASWEEQLAQVFDYTAWHQFVVKVDRANGTGWQLLTRKLHGALSGGEKAIALHLPLFAAVAAHYQAVPEAPRIILLDEVFVGVDTGNRGQVFALLSALDLDLVLTSDHEWCTYAELSGIGIHQLITGGDGDEAVTTARFTWNGRDLFPEDDATS